LSSRPPKYPPMAPAPTIKMRIWIAPAEPGLYRAGNRQYSTPRSRAFPPKP
jgi:hypothetical protein